MKTLQLEALTAASFAPFGQVIEAGSLASHYPINGGSCTRYHDLARLDPGFGGELIASVFRAQPTPLPRSVALLERHPLASQAFIPLSGRPFLVLVGMPSPKPDPNSIRLFMAEASQGVNINRAVWHHSLLALDAISDFLVLDRKGPGANCDEAWLDEPLWLGALAGSR
ncbi:ureidoglycolate lyase [Craterilacuibacter sinensis]|uniref:Ureidoglycolate lyase n=1 Tax=Craterilacuibacter sinensis TaxID=2686017 RepID=A0A845BLB2_9NEIS|nr:ureidoglycolate lyase [Craterilacuibacter sinensis]MXR37082.1 ureidoglycolate lyase [Craterilacuibacter sinensis]RQW29017.1 ureidoglycolate lyase [Rhodobacteraceae bacterium CH30]